MHDGSPATLSSVVVGDFQSGPTGLGRCEENAARKKMGWEALGSWLTVESEPVMARWRFSVQGSTASAQRASPEHRRALGLMHKGETGGEMSRRWNMAMAETKQRRHGLPMNKHGSGRGRLDKRPPSL
jgi:hypothetical protein